MGEGLDIQVWNAIAALAGEKIDLPQSGASLVFALADAPPGENWSVAVRDSSTKVPALVQVVDFPFRPLLDVELEARDIAALPEDLREALHAGMVTAAAETALPGRVPPVVTGQGAVSAFPQFLSARTQWFSIRVETAQGVTFEATLAVDRAAVVRQLADRLPPAHPMVERVTERVPVSIHFTVGAMTVPLRELGLFQPGAVAVMEQLPGASVLVRAGKRRLEFQRADEGWRCGRMVREPAAVFGPSRKGTAMDENLGDPPAGLASMHDLPLTLDFDIGRVSVPLSELSGWTEGTVVQMDPPSPTDGVAVTIRANGEVVGAGEIVRIDDRIAVRVTRFLARS